MPYCENELLDYISGNDLCLGIVIKDGEGKVQLVGSSHNTSRIPHKQILVSHGTAKTDERHALANAQNDISDAMEGIDTGFIWEIFTESPGKYSLAEISDSYFGDKSPVHISALARKLPADVIHFQRCASGVTSIKVHSREESEEIARLRKLRAERAVQRKRMSAWMAKTLALKSDSPIPVPPDMEPCINALTGYLLCGTNSETVNVLSRISDKRGARQCALLILKATDRMPPGEDEFLLSNGIHAGFSPQVMDFADVVPSVFPTEGRNLIDNEMIYSIDDAETREIDDALFCRRDGDDFITGICIADPACFVSKGDLLDAAAADRPLSLYLPTTTVKMFPDRIGCDAASLNEGQLRPSLVFTARLSREAELLDWSIAPSALRVTHHLTYLRADELLNNPDGSPLADSLHDMLTLADTMRNFREEDGAIILNRPELKVRVINGNVTVEAEDQDTPAHRLVSEFMILANHLAAKYALRHELPVIYRVQDPPSGPVASVHTYEPFFFDQQVRRMKRTRLSTYPQPHFGLGLDLYIQISSPLRRYADLVMHRQLSAHCSNKPIPYTQEELFVILDNVDRTSSQNRTLERQATNFWLLEYLRRNSIGKQFMATTMRVEGSMVLAELDFFCVKGVVMTRDKPAPGERINVTVKDVFPDAGRLVLQRE